MLDADKLLPAITQASKNKFIQSICLCVEVLANFIDLFLKTAAVSSDLEVGAPPFNPLNWLQHAYPGKHLCVCPEEELKCSLQHQYR